MTNIIEQKQNKNNKNTETCTHERELSASSEQSSRDASLRAQRRDVQCRATAVVERVDSGDVEQQLDAVDVAVRCGDVQRSCAAACRGVGVGAERKQSLRDAHATTSTRRVQL